jgi:hypothetical protein
MALVETRAIDHHGTLVSMYADILDSAFGRRPKMASPPTMAEAVKELRDCRNRLAETRTVRRPTDWAASALANQVAYDVALIELAHTVGIGCDPDSFDQPELRRSELSRELAARGVQVHEPVTTG